MQDIERENKMSDTFGHTLPTPLARYDLASLSWRTSPVTSLWDLPMSLATLPRWGTTRAGVLYELPTPERLTGAPESSSLPTPRASMGDANMESRRAMVERNGYKVRLEECIAMLPTPTVMDMGSNYTPDEWQAWKDTQKAKHLNGHGASLEQEALKLLPTPTAQAAKHGTTPDLTASGFGSNLWDLPHLLPTGDDTSPPLDAGNL
jgi:hypothetical protein